MFDMMCCTVFSHIGNSRDLQEDNYLIGKGKFLSPERRDAMSVSRQVGVEESHVAGLQPFLVAVSDGMSVSFAGKRFPKAKQL